MILGEGGPAVVISAETAYWLERICKVTALRQRLRDGRHQQVSIELVELRRVALSYDPGRLPVSAEGGRRFAEVAEDSEVMMTVAEVADSLSLTDRAVRMACQQGRVEAERIGGRWLISRAAFENYRAARAAA